MANDKKDEYKTVAQIAKIYGVDVRTVMRWGKEDPGIKKNGKYHFNSVVQGVYKLQRKKLENRGDDSITNKRGTKIDKENYLLDLQIAEKEKKFVDAVDLEKTLSKVFVEFRNIRLIPRAYAQQLSGICQEFINSILKKKKQIVAAREKKQLTVQIESLLIKQLDKALESLSRGFDSQKKKWRGK